MKYLLKVLTLSIVLVTTAWGWQSSLYKYTKDDCITPTNENWSWYGEVVRVLGAFRRLDDVPSYDIYLLQFNPKKSAPWDKPITEQFSLKELEKNTQKIPNWMCESD
jgi:hypothetical protein